ncbi:uncharacterized protein MELLADRAFT_87788 [Melampsora larici-populina 98AG31]|uniref:Uncharacterized protein n=1 Tax=Melampsora larici-populina (strain 98AG31 / pathotype 3-4-7) TaxID=747676 RepID=F4RPG9_MELLP|nr:uncharacterized protein MELLADRAFT_87788 [Melampsora larici-populina 98AG31]EGG05722.1 hypothetical protein MELLADRAFT_87788 [Melampsora larici-populina 98AG31]
MPRLVHGIRKFGDKLFQRLRRLDFIKDSSRTSRPGVPMASDLPISMDNHNDHDGIPEANSGSNEEIGTHIENTPDLIITKGAGIQRDSYRFSTVLELKDLHRLVGHMLNVPGVRKGIPMGIKRLCVRNVKRHRTPRLVHRIRKIGNKLFKRLRRPDFIKDSRRTSGPGVPMASDLPILMDNQPFVNDHDGTLQANSESDEEHLFMEHNLLDNHTSTSSNCSTSNTVPASLSTGTHIERESNDSPLSPLRPRKRSRDRMDDSEDLTITKRARIHTDSYRFKTVLELKDLHRHVRDMLYGKVPGIDEDISVGLKRFHVCNAMQRTFEHINNIFRELLKDDDVIMDDVHDVSS